MFELRVLFLIHLIIISSAELDSDRAKLTTNDGHLLIETPKNKDIWFKTSGSGRFLHNDKDVTEMIATLQKSSNVLEECRAVGTTMDTKFKDLGVTVSKLADQVVTNSNRYTVGGSARLFGLTRRRLNIMQRKLSTISLSLLTNECTSNPCSNGGTCIDMYLSFFCQCPQNWEGPRCETDVNECARFTGTELGCQNSATCVNKPGSYECVCTDGWLGLHCTKRTADCSSGKELCGHGTCITQTTGVGYTCICDQGWKSDGAKPACTVDVNECEDYKPPCSMNPRVICINLPGTFYCGHCPIGYSGNGFYCSDIDECEIFNGGCSMSPMVQCINTMGSRKCGLCPPGYVGNGVSCSFQGGICGVSNGGCHPMAQCKDNPRISSTYVECECPSGYVGNGIGPQGCLQGGTDVCTGSTCVHGVCVQTPSGGYTCNCDRKYTGTNCDIRKNPCESNPCQNGGTCKIVAFSYYCVCTAGFTGTHCQEGKQECGRLTGISGTLQYPLAQQTLVEKNCAWVIEATQGKVLNITFKSISIQNCANNWLQINDGPNTASTIIGRFCGKKLPKGGNFSTSDHSIYLWYKWQGGSPIPSFELTWQESDPVCGGDINVTAHGSFKSPGSPGSYPANRDCYWRFVAPLGKRIQFHFFSFMIGFNKDCSSDYLEFRQGLESSDPVIAKYCNTTHPEPLYSSGNEVLAHFHSDDRGSFPGFQITYNPIAGIPGCGDIFTLDEGEIASPALSGEYPANSLCEYKIKIPGGSQITLTFVTFSLEHSDNCEFDNLAIYDGPSIDSPMIGKYCGKRIPAPVTSLGSEILIVFKSDWSNADLGFKIQYKTVCGGKFIAPSGVIQSPNYPNYKTIKSHSTCKYEILQPVGNNVIIKITDMDFGNNTESCDTGYLEINDNIDVKAKPYGTLCKRGPISITSYSNYLVITYVANFGRIKGFRLEYNTTNNNVCGGVLKAKVGSVESPEDLNSYANGLECAWTMVAPLGYVIQITWVKFNLEESYACTYDQVKIIDNGTDPGSEMGTYCGNKIPPTLLSSSNKVTIFFKVDNSNNQDGFLFTYTFIHEKNVCGGRYFTTSGFVKSPHYPDPYPINKDCVWVITVPPGQQILLNSSIFDIESYLNCRYDFLEIRNGGTAASPLIGKYCGKVIPRLIPSHANQLYLHFKSDMTKTAPGFQLSWSSTATGCGGTLTAPTGSIISPHYPEPYSKNAECFWKISVSAGSVIQIVFADLDLEMNPSCVLDFVEIFDGMGTAVQSLGRYCILGVGIPPYIRSTSNFMTVKFRSDLSFQGRGFQIQYTTICTNKVSGYWGVIESPNYPNNYPNDQKCLWEIGVSEGNKINITFSHFELGKLGQVKCNTTDYLKIRYYDSEEDKQVDVGTYCNENTPTQLTINSNRTELEYVTDKLLQGSGFRLEWNIVGCGGVLEHPEGTISTPGYPNAYPTDTRCDWLLKTDYGSSIEIVFTKIDLEKENDCAYDYIIIYNGKDDSYPAITTFCHIKTSAVKVTTSGNNMLVRFQSDSSYRGIGFEAKYKSIVSKCGGTLSAASGTIHSPHYPNNYDRNDSCVWLLTVEENHVVNLTLQDIDFPKICTRSFVKVYDGPSQAYPVLATLCGNQKPNASIISSTNHMVVEMVAYPYFTTKGFLAKYTTGCGARIKTQSSGLINFAEHTSPSEDSSNCSYTIEAERPDEHISLTITYLSSSCDYDKTNAIHIYDGENNKAPLIGNYCGTKIPPMIKSTGSVLHIEINDPEIHFNARYTVLDTACGGVLESVDGNFATPNFPQNYPVDIQCEWTIQSSKGNKVQVEFSNFDIAKSDNCNEDYLEIREKDFLGRLLGVFCGDNKPTNISSNESLLIVFRSDKPLVGEGGSTSKGFKAEYNLVHGNELEGPTGQIASPQYPRYYKSGSHDSTFSWKITVKNAFQIALKFLDFDMDYTVSGSCFLSYLDIYDGDSDTAPVLGSFCGSEKPDDQKSSSNVLFIKANFDIIRRGAKFLLQWNEVYRTRTFTLPTSNTSCGSDDVTVLTNGDHFELKSPNYPGKYPLSSNCTWLFQTTSDKHLGIHFKDINLRNMIPCIPGNSITVYSGSEKTGDYKLQEAVCQLNGSVSKIVETTNMMKVAFSPSNYFSFRHNYTGFSAVVFTECGGSIDMPNGIIEIQNISNFYKHPKSFVECEWNVTVKSGRTIMVQFLDFQLEGSANCNNYLMLKNGQYQDSPLLGTGKYCGNKVPETLNTTGNFLYLKYFSESTLTSFRLRYSEVSINCGGEILLSFSDNSTIISSPNFPNVPSPHLQCEWIIIAPGGESVRLDFQDKFTLITDPKCSTEAVEVRNGGTQFSPLIGRFCKDMPNSQVSVGNMMYIKYYTDDDFPKNGFKAKASIATCGGIMRYSGSIKSPNYFKNKFYPASAECKWSLVGKKDHSLKISFDTIDLPFSFNSNCSDVDHVTITETNPINNTEVILGEYCGSTPAKNILSASNQVFVSFVTNKRYKLYNGFKLSFESSQDECGGSFTRDSGTITSPGYPAMNHYHRNCQWTIEVPKGRRIKLTLEDLDFDKSINFFSQGLAVFNGEKFSSPVTYFKAGADLTDVRSSDNIMTIFFWSSTSSSSRGFKASYTSDEPTVCIGDLDQEAGTIVTPNSTVFKCIWTREAVLVNQTIALFIKANFSKPHLPCNSGYSYIFAKTGTPANTISEVCQSTDQSVVRSPNKLTLMVSNSEKKETLDFTIKYKVYPCGGLRTDNFGTLTTIDFTNGTYADDLECSWLIKVPSDQGIKITFTDFKLQNEYKYNHLTIYNGPDSNSPHLGAYSTNPQSITSNGNALWLEYHRSKASSGRGFKLTYETVTNGCGGIVNSQASIIQTPAYPNTYPDNAECLWEIRAPPGYHINVNFIERFQIESSDKCENDYVQVYNEMTDEGKTGIQKYCGREPPARSLNSTSNRMFVLFRSNSRISGVGFKIQWKLICGGVFDATSTVNYIVSPGYPDNYSNDLYCNYTIIAPNKYIIIDFEDFDVEKTPGCTYDSVIIRSKRIFTTSDVRYCGTQKPTYEKFRNSLTILFSTDKWVTRRGFKLSYKTDECGGNVTAPTILRPIGINRRLSYGFGLGYKVCKWNILAPKDHRVIIKFLSVNMMYSATCASQYVEVADPSGKLADVCGFLNDTQLPTIHSNNRSVTVTSRHLSAIHSSTNFEAAVYFTPGPALGCGGDFTVKNSTRYLIDAEHSSKYDCIWRFTTDNDYNFKIEFLDTKKCQSNNGLAVSNLSNCTCGVYEIRDGITSASELINTFCDFQVNTSLAYYTSKKYAFIRIVNADSSSHTPKIKLTSIPSICGQSILKATTTPQYITTPNYPATYPPGLKCVWRIKTYKLAFRIQVKLVEFELNTDKHDGGNNSLESCSGVDRLELTNLGRSFDFGHDVVTAPRYSRLYMFASILKTVTFCSKDDKGYEYLSKINDLQLTFHSGYEKTVGKGFKIEYQIATCDRNYTDLNGKITKNWFGFMCSIYITVPKNYTISLYFDSFSFYSADCNKSAFVVFDGDSSKTELLKTCRRFVPPPVFSTGNQLYIRLHGEARYSYNVFDLTYTSSSKDRGCGGDIYNVRGTLTSPLYPLTYTKDITCEWNIKVPLSLGIAFSFTFFDIQGPCSDTYVTVVTYMDNTSNAHVFCAGDKPAVLLSYNKIDVKYKTSHSNLGTGWKAKYISDSDFGALKANRTISYI